VIEAKVRKGMIVGCWVWVPVQPYILTINELEYLPTLNRTVASTLITGKSLGKRILLSSFNSQTCTEH